MIHIDSYISGKLHKSLTGYNYFLPTKINDQWEWQDAELNTLIEQAALKLGELNSYSKLVPNLDLYLQLHITKEAVISSKIEGTQTQIGEALMDETDINPERRNDWKEVHNYIKSLNEAIGQSSELPISSRLIRDTHRILMDSVRGQNKQPGEYRTSQNWIGGHDLMSATYVPPSHDHISELMSDLEKFVHNEEIQVSELIKIALVHYQFETIHPFLDGNGRIGRLLITLMLVDKQLLNQPLLYLSAYFDKNRGMYYDQLTAVRVNNDISSWIKYFLIGVKETAEEAVDTLSRILEMKDQLEKKINAEMGRRSPRGLELLQHLYQRPIINVKKAQTATGLSYNAANTLISDLMKIGILKETTGYNRNRVFVFESYINLF